MAMSKMCMNAPATAYPKKKVTSTSSHVASISEAPPFSNMGTRSSST